MNLVSRGVRNAFRNQIRTFSIVVILGLSIGLSLAMLIARQAVQNKIESVKSSIGNTVSISPAGARGFQGGGEPLVATQVAKLKSIPNVVSVSETLSDRFTTTTSNLVSAINAGTLGNRRAGDSGVGFSQAPDVSNMKSRQGEDGNGQQITRTFTPPVIATGTNDTVNASVYGGDSVTFTSGKVFDANTNDNVAVLGKSLASKNSLTVGSSFTAYGQSVKVVGIFDSGNTFSNAGLVMPLLTLQRLSGQGSGVTGATVTVNSIDNIDKVTTAVKTVLGSTADVVNDQIAAQQSIEPLENVKTISLYSLIGSVVAGAVIILLTMIMIVRERRREIGVMKAIGASNHTIMLQFIFEAVTLTALGLIVGLIIGIASASPVTNVLVTNSSSSVSSQSQAPNGGGRIRGGGSGLRQFGRNGLTNVRNVKAEVGLSILGYGIGAAMIIAIIGSALPAFLISKIRPAEVMRAE